jgi:hypothetical protein
MNPMQYGKDQDAFKESSLSPSTTGNQHQTRHLSCLKSVWISENGMIAETRRMDCSIPQASGNRMGSYQSGAQ